MSNGVIKMRIAEEPRGEFQIPIAVHEVFNDSHAQFIMCQSRTKVAIEEAYVDGDIYKLKEALVIEPDHGVKIPVPSKYTKQSVAGVFASSIDDKGNIVARFPIGGSLVSTVEPCDITIGPTSATAGKFTPNRTMLTRFKRFNVTVTGAESNRLWLDQLSINGQIVIGHAMPFAMALRESALHIPTLIPAGGVFSYVFSNPSHEPITVSGTLVFEAVAESRTPSRSHAQRN